ncbi:MAG: alpha-galactosidase [Planctomycetota bacterium]
MSGRIRQLAAGAALGVLAGAGSTAAAAREEVEPDVAVVLADGTRIASDEERFTLSRGEGGTRRYADSRGQLDLAASGGGGEGDGAKTVAVTNRGAEPLRLARVEVLVRRFSHDGSPGHVLPNGLHSWHNLDPALLVPGAPPQESWWTIALEEPPIAAGFLTARRAVGRFSLAAGEKAVILAAWQEGDGCELAPGETWTSDPLFLSTAPHPLAEMERFADLAAEANGARLALPNRATWCSWYAGWIREGMYATKDGLEAGIADTVPRVAALFGGRGGASMRIVDDSDAMPYGDWDDVTKALPGGFDRLVRRMAEHGVTPGIWLPVYWASDRSRLFRDHPDWLGRTPEDEILTRPLYGNTVALLDSTHPEALAHLEGIAASLRARGFRYVMTDFLVTGTEVERYHDPAASKGEAHRRGLEALRRGFGDEVYWLGCGALLGSCMGLADGMRISGDSFGDQPFAYRQAGSRWFYHRRLWRNDPDAIVCRGKSVEWNQAWMSWMALAGCVLTYGDTFDDLGPEQVAAYQRIFPPLDIAGRPLDLWENDPHLLWGVAIGEGERRTKLFGLFHFDDAGGLAVELNLDEIAARIDSFAGRPDLAPRGYLLWDFWNEELLEVEGPRLGLPMPERGGRVFALHPATGRPQLLGTTGHFSMGAPEVPELAWDEGAKALRGRVRGNGGDATTLFFHAPAGFQLLGGELAGGPGPDLAVDGNVLAVRVSPLAAPVPFALRFAGEAGPAATRPFVAGRAASETVPGFPGADAATVERLRALARRAPLGYRLADYLDCGRGAPAAGEGAHLVPRRGTAYAWEPAVEVAGASAASVLYDEKEVELELVGLDPGHAYQIGFSWWDFDGNGRVQSVRLRVGSGDLLLLDRVRLPAWIGARQGPESLLVLLPLEAAAAAGARIVFTRAAPTPNAVLGEIWLFEER